MTCKSTGSTLQGTPTSSDATLPVAANATSRVSSTRKSKRLALIQASTVTVATDKPSDEADVHSPAPSTTGTPVKRTDLIPNSVQLKQSSEPSSQPLARAEKMRNDLSKDTDAKVPNVSPKVVKFHLLRKSSEPPLREFIDGNGPSPLYI